MNNKIKFILIILLCGFTLSINAQDIWKEFEHLFVPAKNYVVYKSTSEINIDGKPIEYSWSQAAWSEYFNDIEGNVKPKPLHKTRVKMLWDDANLYILAELEEPNIWAYYNKNDMIVFHENDFEVFIDPDRDTHNYYEFEVNAQNTLFDLFLDKPYRNGGNANIKWNAEGFKSAINIEGTLNNPADKDIKWTVEMAIPFSSLTTNGNFIQPDNGSVWKINFSRVNWQTDVVDGKYVRKKNTETNKNLPEFNWVWSPQGVINMHYPERWSMAQFSSIPISRVKEKFRLPAEEEFGKYLWLVYYKQKQFVSENGKYASSLAEIGVPVKGEENGVSYTIELLTEEKTFEATLKTKRGLKISINEQGLFMF